MAAPPYRGWIGSILVGGTAAPPYRGLMGLILAGGAATPPYRGLMGLILVGGTAAPPYRGLIGPLLVGGTAAPPYRGTIGPILAVRALGGQIAAMAKIYPTIIEGLRSPSAMVGGLVYFGRMVDKIRLHAAGKLPEDWQPARGMAASGSFDARCCRFLKIDYAALETEVLKGDKSDEELLAWAYAQGRRPGEEEVEIWNDFMSKRGWRDGVTQRLHERLAEIGLPLGTVETMFEFIDLDEGRRKLP